VLLVILLRSKTLKITRWTTKWAQIPVTVFRTPLPIIPKVDEMSFEVTFKNFATYGDSGIKTKPERKSSSRYLGGFLKSYPGRKRSLNRITLWMFSSRVNKKKTILFCNIHFAIKLIDRAVVNL
jgi:hypothetical protein